MNVAQIQEQSDSNHVNHRAIRFPIVFTPLLHPAVSTHASFVLVQSTIIKMLALETPNSLNFFVADGKYER